MYRKIAVASHPDKLPDSILDKDRDQLSKAYQDATTCYKSGNYSKLLLISLDLRLDLGEIGDSHIKELRRRNDFLENEISEYKTSLLFEWPSLSEDQKKDAVISFGLSRGWVL